MFRRDISAPASGWKTLKFFVKTSSLVLQIVSCSLCCAEGLHVYFLVGLAGLSVRSHEKLSLITSMSSIFGSERSENAKSR